MKINDHMTAVIFTVQPEVKKRTKKKHASINCNASGMPKLTGERKNFTKWRWLLRRAR